MTLTIPDKCIAVIISFWLLSCNEKVVLLADMPLALYPSGSAIAYKNKQFYLAGDDASNILILDDNFRITDSIPLFHSSLRRMPKNEKADIEDAGFVFGSRSQLLAICSGSVTPQRDSLYIIQANSHEHLSISLDTFYRRLQYSGLKEINIEGLASVPWGMILSNRGHKGYPKNYLIITGSQFWMQQQDADIRLIPVGGNHDSSLFQGISGLCYSGMSDRLIMSVSTEDTYSSHADGAIGKSFLWIIDDFSAKRKFSAINPNHIIELPAYDKKLRGQKIEAVCIVKETNKNLWLALSADNDDGTTHLFYIKLQK